jgi:hypothetical protein
MSNTASNRGPRQDAFWWQVSLMEIKAYADGTGHGHDATEGHSFEEEPPPVVPSRKDEAKAVLEGQVRSHMGDDELITGPGRP